MTDKELVKVARESKASAFAPYSEFQVGASLLTEQGVYTGANIEISGRSTSVHAEMLAAYKAVQDGAEEFQVMAISAGETPSGDIAPCGLCQHTLSQFTEELRILEDAGDEEPEEYSLLELIGDGYSASTRHFDQIRDKE
jgi:cytidine deaminase